MGSNESKPEPGPQTPVPQKTENPLFDRPWREPSTWNYSLEKKIKIDIEQIKPKGTPNILLSGPVGSGKSSFINAVFSIGEGKRVSRAQTGSSASSYTTEYKGYTQKTLLKNFILRDTMGIEPNNDVGFHIDDFIYLVKGHIINKYKFHPACSITPQSLYYRKEPEPMDVIHCVIFVISAVDIYNDIPEPYVRKIGHLQLKLRSEHVPRTLILTMADKLCEKVNEDVKNMFRSRKIQKAVKIASEVFHIDQASIHPVVNYEVGFELTPEQNIPLLFGLRQSMQYADDFIEQAKDDEEIR